MNKEIMFCGLLCVSSLGAMSDDNTGAAAAVSAQESGYASLPEGTKYGSPVVFYQQGEEDAVLRCGFFKDLGMHPVFWMTVHLEYRYGQTIAHKDVLIPGEESSPFEGGKEGTVLMGDNLPVEVLEEMRKVLFSQDEASLVSRGANAIVDFYAAMMQKPPSAATQIRILKKLLFDGVRVSSQELDELCELCSDGERKKTIYSCDEDVRRRWRGECDKIKADIYARLAEFVHRPE